MRRTAVTMAAVGGLAAGAAGCSAVAEQAAEQAAGAAAGGEVDVDTDDGALSVDTGDGEFSVESSAKIPTVVSDLMTVPDAFVAQSVQTATLDEGEMTQVMGTIDVDDPAVLLDSVEQELAADGFETTTNSSVGGEMYTLLMGKEDVATVTVGIILDGEPAEMSISVMRPAA